MTPRTEQQLLDATIDLATRCGWLVHHDRPARRGTGGWATHISGHAGFPDLVLCRCDTVLYRELKAPDRNGRIGRLTDAQRKWAQELVGPGIDWDIRAKGLPEAFRRALRFDVWTPDDWEPLIVPTLTARVKATT